MYVVSSTWYDSLDDDILQTKKTRFLIFFFKQTHRIKRSHRGSRRINVQQYKKIKIKIRKWNFCDKLATFWWYFKHISNIFQKDIFKLELRTSSHNNIILYVYFNLTLNEQQMLRLFFNRYYLSYLPSMERCQCTIYFYL